MTPNEPAAEFGNRAAALLLPFSLVEIRDALFGYDMAYVVAVDHDGGYRHPCLLANLNRVQSLNECRNATALKGLHGLHDKLSTANDRFDFTRASSAFSSTGRSKRPNIRRTDNSGPSPNQVW